MKCFIILGHPGQNEVMPDSLTATNTVLEVFSFFSPNFGNKGKNVSEQQRPQEERRYLRAEISLHWKAFVKMSPKFSTQVLTCLCLSDRETSVEPVFLFWISVQNILNILNIYSEHSCFPYPEYLLHLVVVCTSLWEADKFLMWQNFKKGSRNSVFCYIPVFVVMKAHLLSF